MNDDCLNVITAILHHLLTDYKGMNDEPFLASKSNKFRAISHWLVTVEVGRGGDFCAKSSRNMFVEFFVLFSGQDFDSCFGKTLQLIPHFL